MAIETHPWTSGVDKGIEKKAFKDFAFYKGLEVRTSCINIAPDGWSEIREGIIVRVKDLIMVEQYDSDYIDCSWSVEIKPEDAEMLDPLTPFDQLDPYIRGMTYCIEEGILVGHYRGFNPQNTPAVNQCP